MSPRKQVSLETEYDRALQSVCVIICDFVCVCVCLWGPRKGPGEGTPSLGRTKQMDPVFCVFLPLYFLVALLTNQAGLPCPRPHSSHLCTPRLANLGASGL
uniref:Uncharacterized protein n=1 Tax=Macaca mulatta TaxID=9544 RepID=A0A5F8A9F5_MACMU